MADSFTELTHLTDGQESASYDAVLQALRFSEARLLAFSDALPGITWSATPTGELEFVSDSYVATRGRPREAALGHGWLDSVHDDDRAHARARWESAIASGAPYDAQFRVRSADGTYRWQLVRAHAVRDTEGAIVRWAGINVDIDEQRKVDDAREMFVALANNSPDLFMLADERGIVHYLNPAGRRMMQLDAAYDATGSQIADYFVHGDRATAADVIFPALAREGRWIGDFALRDAVTGIAIPVEFHAFRLFDTTQRPMGIASVAIDRRARKRTERGLDLLSRAGRATLESVDYATTLANIAHAVVDAIASYCLIDVLGAHGDLERTAVHPDPELQSVLESLSTPTGDHPIARAMRGESSVSVIDERWLRAIRATADRDSAIASLGVRSIATVPVTTPTGDVVGALTAALDIRSPWEDYNADDLVFIEEVGRRAGAAIANARLYERDRRIAVEFQAASLPLILPKRASIDIDADYRPASNEALIGGDWYDAFDLADGRLAITVGDVIGHGLHAAVTMTKLRHAMHAAAMLRPDPEAMLMVADRTLRAIDPDGYATAMVAIYDDRADTVTIASAGHAGPVIRYPDGTSEHFSISGMMLGLRDTEATETIAFSVPSGSTLVFFTDGLTEATRDSFEGTRRLLEAVRSESVCTARKPAQVIVDRVLAGAPARDDIAVLVVRIGTAFVA